MIRVVLGDIAGAVTEAVLRPVSAEWTAVTAAMRRLEVAAGSGVQEQCRRLGDLPVGSAAITGAGDLAAQFMIHVIVRSAEEPVSPAGIRRGLQNGLRRAGEWGIRRIALAPLGTGAGNLDADDAATIMVPLLREQLAGGALDAVEIHVETTYERDVFERHAAAQ